MKAVTQPKSSVDVKQFMSNGKRSNNTKYVYFFSEGRAEGRAGQKSLLGGKGANLSEMCHLGIPVPPGFTISTEACTEFYTSGRKFPAGLIEEISTQLKALEVVAGKNFGSIQNPLLVSVRSGAAVSMPGMMDTILNLGLNDETVKGLAQNSGNERFAFDSYRRFIQMFSNVVLGIDHHYFEAILTAHKKKNHAKQDTDLDAIPLKGVVVDFKALVRKRVGKPFPQNPMDQLYLACAAVFSSWNNDRANTYRNLNKIPHDIGTACNVQSMVFGNLGETSGTGVAFTRDPGTGQKLFFGEYLINAQGEDVVAGIRTPRPIADLNKQMPHVYEKLVEIYKKLEKHYRDMQDIEFTIENEVLYLLQTRNGKRTALAAVTIACDLVQEGVISKEEAVLRVQPEQLDQLLHPMIDPKAKLKVIAKGLPASPGAAVGRIVFESEVAQIWSDKKKGNVILVRQETSPEDVGGMAVSAGILTATGGMTSHAAVVARGMGKCCIAGCSDLHIDMKKKECTIGNLKFKEGDTISLNGSTGQVILGEAKLVKPKVEDNFSRIMDWADRYRVMKVRTNADTPEDARLARSFGAEGIGLCRTEHMFFGDNRLKQVRKMILADNESERRKALSRLEPFQRNDFKGIFEAMNGLPVTIRLLDPPLHEFLPKSDKEIAKVARDLKLDIKRLKKKVEILGETNPMLGHRGCRLAVTYPEIYQMQTEAILEAACDLVKKGIKVFPEIMVPLICIASEFELIKKDIIKVADRVLKKKKVNIVYKIGTMIEIPRAALTAKEVARTADFFSFGTNDLTQMTFGFSRDDVGKFLPYYIEKGLMKIDPFASLDQKGVGLLIQSAVKAGRSVKPDLKVGICGEHGGDPESIHFCQKNGLDYVSCSPYRVPIARLAAAHAAINVAKDQKG